MLHATDVKDVSIGLYNGDAAGKRGRPGAWVRFLASTVADGKVFIGTQTELDIFGLLQ